MTYENVPEHAGFEGVSLGDGEETAASVEDRRPLIVTPTDEWLARISDQLQSFADLIDEVRAEADDEGDDESSDVGGADKKGTGAPDPAAPPATPPASDDKSTPAKKTTPAPPKKQVEVRGD